jgi:hypothetical protein
LGISVSKPSFEIGPKGNRSLERALACSFVQIVRRPQPQQIPPLWVRLAELSEWLDHVYGLGGGALVRELVTELRTDPSHFRLVSSDGQTRIVPSWDEIEAAGYLVDWETGDVYAQDGSIHFPLEVSWRAVTDCVSRWRLRQKRELLSAPALESMPEPPKRGGGRRQKYDWPYVTLRVLERLQNDGVPVEGDGGQAKLERFVTGLFPPDDDLPAESVIRDRVHGIIAAFRRRLRETR